MHLYYYLSHLFCSQSCNLQSMSRGLISHLNKKIHEICNIDEDGEKHHNFVQLWTQWIQTKQQTCSWRTERIWKGEDLGSKRQECVIYNSPKLGFSTGFQGTQDFTPGGFQRTLESTTEAHIKKWYLGRISLSNSANFHNLLVFFFLGEICLYAVYCCWMKTETKNAFHHVYPALQSHLPAKLVSKTHLLNTRSSLTLL